jgi:hypothetical protein
VAWGVAPAPGRSVVGEGGSGARRAVVGATPVAGAVVETLTTVVDRVDTTAGLGPSGSTLAALATTAITAAAAVTSTVTRVPSRAVL